MTCKFCEDIKPIDDRKKFDWGGLQIVSCQGEYHIYDDYPNGYFSGIALREIKYCPYCGRKLEVQDAD